MRSRGKGQTIFELLIVLCAFAGLSVGAQYGAHWGWLATIAGGALGAVLGYGIGFLPLVLCLFIIAQSEKRQKRQKP